MKTFLIYEETVTEIRADSAAKAERYYLDVVVQHKDPEHRIREFRVDERSVEEVIPLVDERSEMGVT
jgi:hypothetical protein